MEYEKFVKEQLKLTKTKVHRWIEWDPECDRYEAFVAARRVVIPKPVCDWSFLVALHEIGHVSTGERLHSYLQEYNAERWAIRRAKQAYGIVCPDYEIDAKTYVKKHLIENLIFSELSLQSVKPYVLEWLGESQDSIKGEIASIITHALIQDYNWPINYKNWLPN